MGKSFKTPTSQSPQTEMQTCPVETEVPGRRCLGQCWGPRKHCHDSSSCSAWTWRTATSRSNPRHGSPRNVLESPPSSHVPRAPIPSPSPRRAAGPPPLVRPQREASPCPESDEGLMPVTSHHSSGAQPPHKQGNIPDGLQSILAFAKHVFL